jgi:hypothetical protein
VTATARKAPLLTCGTSTFCESIMKPSRPATRSFIAAGVERYGTRTKSRPAILANSISPRSAELPGPAEPQLMVPGRAFT